eukprot:CAMPEP_0171135246 /NCGR_PEP_ID=MMETSP0766_2-20121228/129471_1 /TAXON_ID=439317 /ORGANISM="Gambierdiscus australes, Strain CAWD 149" /LENGTH=198 /DNA_ID=CAMNT_0011598735 /DNA_START=60 /DNA_END=653 /DNA_ORIENTATION=-
MIRTAGSSWLCQDCQDAVRVTEEEAQMLRALDEIEPTFAVWDRNRREESWSRTTDLEVEQPGEVRPQLFIGDLDDAMAVSKLQGRGIKAVLSLCPERRPEMSYYGDLPARLEGAGIKLCELAARDAYDFDIESVVPASCEFIEAQLREGGGVLVNCWGGVNRSAAVVVAFLLQCCRADLIESVRAVTRARGRVLTNRH